MAPDLDRTRSLTPPRRPAPVSRDRPGVPSGPPQRLPGPPTPESLRQGPLRPIAAPTVAPERPERRQRLVPVIGVLATVTLAGCGVYLAFGRDDDEDPSPATDPATTAVPATFAVDLSTGDDDPTQATVLVPSSTLPLPSIGLPMPGAPTTVD